jgi:hypothetical protein
MLHRSLGARRGILEAIEGLTSVAVARKEAEQAARLLGAAAALWEALGAGAPSRAHAEAVADAGARAGLPRDALAAAHAEGRAMSLEQAVAYALGMGDGGCVMRDA